MQLYSRWTVSIVSGRSYDWRHSWCVIYRKSIPTSSFSTSTIKLGIWPITLLPIFSRIPTEHAQLRLPEKAPDYLHPRITHSSAHSCEFSSNLIIQFQSEVRAIQVVMINVNLDSKSQFPAFSNLMVRMHFGRRWHLLPGSGHRVDNTSKKRNCWRHSLGMRFCVAWLGCQQANH